MKRKAAPKSKTVKKTKIRSQSYIRYAVIILVFLAILILLSIFEKATGKVFVLGSSTAPTVLADQSDQPDTNQSGDQQGSTPAPQSAGDVQNSTDQKSTSETLVDCIKPDGTHFTTSFHDCQELNQKMGQNTFNFTSLSNPDEKNNEQPEPSPEPSEEPNNNTLETAQGDLEMQTEGNKGELNLETAGMHIEMKKEDNGSIKITAHKADGTEVQLQLNALDQINESLKDKDIEVSTTSANGFAIKSAGVQAETNFPLSLDPTTKSLSVTTSNGTTADVTTLPNQAVQNVIQLGALTNVLSSANQTTPNAAAGNNNLDLTEKNNQPVYAIQGVSTKNLLGLFPIAYRKTVYVSAQDGQIVQVEQSLITQILQALSF